MRPSLTLAILLIPLLLCASASGLPARLDPVHAMPVVPSGGSVAPLTSSNLAYHGGLVETVPKVYLVFWAWNGVDPSGEETYLTHFFQGVGGTGWANIQTQYTEQERGAITNPSGQLGGVWDDSSATTVPLDPDNNMQQEVLAAVAHFGYDVDADYVIATPHGHSTSGFGSSFCAWHSALPLNAGRFVAYTNLPYIPDAGSSCGKNFVNAGAAGNLDGVSMVAGHEYAEAATDPGLDAWYDASGQETGDKCAWRAPGTSGGAVDLSLSTGSFAVQSLWSNAAGGCVVTYP